MTVIDSRPRFVKIVRDKVGKFLGTTEVTYRPASQDDVVSGLRAKLIEEAAEYLLNPSIGELADLVEVIHGLARWDLGVDIHEVKRESLAKLQERGGFDDGIGMYVETTAPARHEGEHAEF